MSQLVLAYTPEAQDDVSLLDVEVQAAGFAGRGASWTNDVALADFAAALGVYPISADQPAVFEMGFGRLEGDDLVARIEIGPADPLGRLLVQVELSDRNDRWRRVRTTFTTHYPDVERFARQIGKMIGAGGPATLQGD